MPFRDDTRKLLSNHHRRLQALEERKALYGLETPISILTEIEDIKAEIERLQSELELLRDGEDNDEIFQPSHKRKVVIIWKGDFSTERKSAAIDAFAAIIGISPQAIEVYGVYPGSIVLELGIPSNAVQHLRFLLETNNEQLRLVLEKVLLEKETGEVEEWVNEGGILNLTGRLRSDQVGARWLSGNINTGKFVAPNFSISQVASDSAIQIGQARIVNISSPRSISTPPPFQVLPLHPKFVPRPEEFEVHKACLLNDDITTPGVLTTHVIYGMGGIGKSTLAAALALDLDVRKRFSDGTLRVVLGQEPDLLSLLKKWIEALGNREFSSSDIEDAVLHLNSLLHDKAILLLVDDAWQSSHVKHFRVGGPRCRLLVTTRNEEIAREIGTTSRRLDSMRESEALALMEKWAGSIDGEAKTVASQLALELKYLPLALQLVSAQVTRVGNWQTLRDEWARVGSEISDPLRRTFELSLNALSTNDREAYLLLGVFPKNTPFPISAASKLLDLEEMKTASFLRDLANQALLTRQEIKQKIYYSFHDLLHDFVTKNLGEQGLHSAHNALLKGYRRYTQNSLWHTLSDDGYIHTHLSWHMEQAGCIELLHELLREETSENQNGWYQKREALGQTVGYLIDVKRAWRLSEEAFVKHHSSIDLGRQFRYALINVSLNSVATNISPILLAALVEKSIWPPAQALAYARQVPNLDQRARALAKLILPLAKVENYQETLAVIQDIELILVQGRQNENDIEIFERELTAALIELVKCLQILPHELKQEFLRVGQEIIRDEKSQVLILTALVPHLTEAEKEKVLIKAMGVAKGIRNSQSQAQALAALIPYLPNENLPDEVFATAREIRNEIVWVDFLTGLGPFLPVIERLKKHTVARILTAVQEINDEWNKAKVLAGLAPYLVEEPLQRELLTTTLAIISDRGKAKALAGLVPYLPKILLQEALQFWPRPINDPQEAENEGWRARALAKVDDYQQALEVTQKIKDKRGQVRVLANLSEDLPEQLKCKALREAVTVAKTIESEWNRAKILAELLPHLRQTSKKPNCNLPQPEYILDEILVILRGIQSERSQANGLVELIPYAREVWIGEEQVAALVNEAIKVAKKTESEWSRTETLMGLIPRLIEVGYPQEALALVRAIDDVDEQRRTLKEIAFRLIELASPREALATMGIIKWDSTGEVEGGWEQAVAQAGLVPHLIESPKLEPQVVQRLIKAIEADDQTDTLIGLARRLAELDHPKEALTAAQLIRGEKYRATALMELAQLLPESSRSDVLVAALGAARAIEDEKSRTVALTKLVQLLPESLKGEALAAALAAAQAIEDEKDRTTALTELAQLLPTWLKGRVLTATRAKALAELWPHLPEQEQRDNVLKEAKRAADAIRDEWARMEALAELALLLVELGFPREAIEVVEKIEGNAQAKWTRIKVLAELTPRLPFSWRERILRWVLRSVQEISIEEYLAEILTKIAPVLPKSLMEEALKAAQSLVIKKHRVEALTALSPYLPPLQRREILEEILHDALLIGSQDDRMGSIDDRATALTKLAPYLEERALMEEAIDAVRAIDNQKSQAKALAGLVPYLPGPLLWDVSVTAGAIQTEEHRTEVFSVLVPQLIAIPQIGLIELWQPGGQGSNFLHTLANRTRRDLLSDLRILVPLIAALDGVDAMVETARAIQDVGRWWP